MIPCVGKWKLNCHYAEKKKRPNEYKYATARSWKQGIQENRYKKFSKECVRRNGLKRETVSKLVL